MSRSRSSRGSLFLLAVLTFLVGSACGGSAGGDEGAPSTTEAAVAEMEGVAIVPVDGANHVNGTVQYPTSPPAGGNHNPVWQNCGFYTRELVPELAVHSLEHGAVWITFRPDADKATRDAINAIAAQNKYVLASPYADNPAPIVLTAWARQMRLERIDDPKVQQFLDLYMGDGPTTREPGASCSGAVGIPPDQPTGLVR
jgi:hypothetical protein